MSDLINRKVSIVDDPNTSLVGATGDVTGHEGDGVEVNLDVPLPDGTRFVYLRADRVAVVRI